MSEGSSKEERWQTRGNQRKERPRNEDTVKKKDINGTGTRKTPTKTTSQMTQLTGKTNEETTLKMDLF